MDSLALKEIKLIIRSFGVKEGMVIVLVVGIGRKGSWEVWQ